MSSDSVEVQLLHPTAGSPMKSWHFENVAAISIGRSSDCLVEIVDPHVSRLHALLSMQDGQWVLSSRGRNGVQVNGQAITEQTVQDGLTFRLGPVGPILRFCKMTTAEHEHLQTISFDPETMPCYTLDQTRLQDEVADITGDEFFLKLQEQARNLRRQRDR